MGVFIRWTGMDHWTTGIDYWNTGMEYWNGLLEWLLISQDARYRGEGGAWNGQ